MRALSRPESSPSGSDTRGVVDGGNEGGNAVISDEPTRAILALVEADLAKLSPRDEQVLRLLFGIGAASHSREEVGRRLGMSRAWLRQVERRALGKLRSAAVAEDETAPELIQRERNGPQRLVTVFASNVIDGATG